MNELTFNLLCLSPTILGCIGISRLIVLEKLTQKPKAIPEPPKDYLLECFEELEKNWIENDPVQVWLGRRMEEEQYSKSPPLALNQRYTHIGEGSSYYTITNNTDHYMYIKFKGL